MNGAIDCSIVLAVLSDATAASLSECIAMLKASSFDLQTELIVVTGAGSREVAAQLPSMVDIGFQQHRIEKAASDALTPDLWGAGFRVASGRAVMFTTSQVAVREDALIVMSRLIKGEVVGVGGAIEIGKFRGPASDAVYFARFSSFLPELWPTEMRATDIPGDNSMYLRSALVAQRQLSDGGFWEAEYHREFAGAGRKLAMHPKAVATLAGSSKFFRALHQRYVHGVLHGETRVLKHGLHPARIVILAPLVPLVLLARIGRRALSSSRSTLRFLLASPWVALLTLMWAIGEAVGATRAQTARKSVAV